jgi:hypothetical protein
MMLPFVIRLAIMGSAQNNQFTLSCRQRAVANHMVSQWHPGFHQFRVVGHHVMDIEWDAQVRPDFIQFIRPVVRCQWV